MLDVIAAAWFIALALTTSLFLAVVVGQSVVRQVRDGSRATRAARAGVPAHSRSAQAA